MARDFKQGRCNAAIPAPVMLQEGEDMKLMIVESPGKVKKIQGFLGSDWRVQASVGHVRDLPIKEMGVAAPDFVPQYVETERGKEVLAGLAAQVKQSDEVYLGTDPDREGEAIAWHLQDALHLNNPRRVTFGEITEKAVKAAIASPRSIDDNLVGAQEGRRVLDRLVGYTVSPLVSSVLSEPASAGRVQTPALRLVVDREREIRNFQATTHFGVEALFEAVENVSAGWKALWNNKSWLPEDEKYFLDKAAAERIAGLRKFEVTDFTESESRSAPPTPFITTTLQQAASNKLKLSPKKTMELAQRLYEQGHITYMRTDSPNLSVDFVNAARVFCQDRGWPVPDTPRVWKSKAGAQEAHEAIRPTHIEVEEAGENADEKALYALIRIRTLASLLEDAVFAVRLLQLKAEPLDGKDVLFEAKGRTLLTPGWKVLMQQDDSEDEEGEAENAIPALKPGALLTARESKLLTQKTKPPARYTEATLIKKLEALGIGRPSTYAAILDNIMSRGYIREEKRQLTPSPLGERLVDALYGRFSFVEYNFTKDLENALDSIAAGKAAYKDVVSAAYQVLSAEAGKVEAENLYPCPDCGKPMRHKVKSGKDGYDFWGCSGYPHCTTTCVDDNGRPGAKREAKAPEEPSEFDCEKCGQPLFHRKGEKNGRAYDFFACSNKDCGATFDNVDGKPTARTGKPRELTEHKCGKCGKPLSIYEGVSKAGKPYKKFNCSGYPDCKQSYWVKKDGTPDYDKPLK